MELTCCDSIRQPRTLLISWCNTLRTSNARFFAVVETCQQSSDKVDMSATAAAWLSKASVWAAAVASSYMQGLALQNSAVHKCVLQCNCNPSETLSSGSHSSGSHSCPMAYTRHVLHAQRVYCTTPRLAGFEREVCAVQIVMTVTTAVLCYVAMPRTPQEHVAASTVSSSSIHVYQAVTHV